VKQERILGTGGFVERVLSESRGRRGRIPRIRSKIAERLIKELRIGLARVARLLGVYAHRPFPRFCIE
jgi:hypothetical protein